MMKSICSALFDLLVTALFVLSIPIVVVIALVCCFLDKLMGFTDDDW